MFKDRIYTKRVHRALAHAARPGFFALLIAAGLVSVDARGADEAPLTKPAAPVVTADEVGQAAAGPAAVDKLVAGNAPAVEVDEAAKARVRDPIMMDYRAEAAKAASERDKKVARLTEISKSMEERKAQILKENEEAAELAAAVAELETELAAKKAALGKIFMDDEKLLELQAGMDMAREDVRRTQAEVRETIRRQHAERRAVAETLRREREQKEQEKKDGE